MKCDYCEKEMEKGEAVDMLENFEENEYVR